MHFACLCVVKRVLHRPDPVLKRYYETIFCTIVEQSKTFVLITAV